MSDKVTMQVIKYLTHELRKEPFSRDLNLASFDCMTRDELLQIFNDVLAQLDPNQHVQIIHEDPADTVQRIMEFLRVLKHKCSMEDPLKYRDGIQHGHAEVICPIMAWILEKKEGLKTRAYLANFLVEIEIPDECLLDDDISETRRKYLNLIEEFKGVHKQLERLKTGNNTYGLVSDMQNIEHDLECIRRRIEISRSKFSGYPDLPGILRQARLNRKARDKATELAKQSHLEEQKLRDTEDKIRMNRRIIKDLIEKNGGRTGEGIVEALEETCEVLKYIVLEKIPNEMESNERCITAMRLVENDPPNSQQDLTELKMKTQMVKSELHALESRLIRKLHDGDLQQLREQSDQLDKVRRLKTSKMSCILRELFVQRKLLEHRTLERSSKVSCSDDNGGSNQDGTPSDEQYRLFMKQMRVKAGKYKQMRSELARLQNEAGILASTKFILEGEEKETTEHLMDIESRLGIQGFSETQEKLENLSSQKAVLDETNRTTLYEMSCMSKELNDKIALKKLHLEPLIKDLQSKRLSTQLLESEFNKVKDHYNSAKTAAELDTCHYRAKLEQLSNAEGKSTIEVCRLQTEMSLMRATLENMKEESELQGICIGLKEKGRGFKDKLLTKILEEERRGKALKEESDGIDDFCADRKNQAEKWDRLVKFFKLKLGIEQEH